MTIIVTKNHYRYGHNEEPFDEETLRWSIENANDDVSDIHKLNKYVIDELVKGVESSACLAGEATVDCYGETIFKISSNRLHEFVVEELMGARGYEVAMEYVKYSYEKKLREVEKERIRFDRNRHITPDVFLNAVGCRKIAV